jgi:hypothetical protein
MVSARTLRRRPLWVAIVAGVLGLIVCLVPIPTFALDWQHPKYRLVERRNAAGDVDRQEGIEPVKISGGERLYLIGAFLHVPALQTRQEGNTYRLGFYLQKAEPRVSIKVRDYEVFRERNFIYWMLPVRTRYPDGFGEFPWETTLTQELGIGLQDLQAVAWLRGRGRRPTVAPLLLHIGEFPAQMQTQGCRFVFIPSTAMTVDYRVYPKGRRTQVMKKGLSVPWKRLATVEWDGKDDQKQPAPAGTYILEVEATYTPAPGKAKKKIPFDVAFYYTPVIDTRPHRQR